MRGSPGPRRGPEPHAVTGNTTVERGETLEDLYKEFCATVCFRPGVNLMDYLKENGHTDLMDWFHWDTIEPEPKSLIRLFVATTRTGQNLWEKKGLTFVRDGGWDINKGCPSDATEAALAKLAKILEKPIKLGFKMKPDAEWRVLEFNP
jgi:hypothetical protein